MHDTENTEELIISLVPRRQGDECVGQILYNTKGSQELWILTTKTPGLHFLSFISLSP